MDAGAGDQTADHDGHDVLWICRRDRAARNRPGLRRTSTGTLRWLAAALRESAVELKHGGMHEFPDCKRAVEVRLATTLCRARSSTSLPHRRRNSAGSRRTRRVRRGGDRARRQRSRRRSTPKTRSQRQATAPEKSTAGSGQKGREGLDGEVLTERQCAEQRVSAAGERGRQGFVRRL